MTEFLTVNGGTLAYEVTGDSGPLVVLAHGMGDSRAAYRFLTPDLVTAGYRVVAVDLRGCGESSAGWPSYTQADIAGDLIAVLHHLGTPAVLVGHSISGGAATIVAADAPTLVTAVIELAPFTRKQKISLRDFRVAPYRRAAVRLLGAGLFGSVRLWSQYLEFAFPGQKSVDWDARQAEIAAMLREPGRMKAMQRMGMSGTADSDSRLGRIECPVLVVEGTLDPDWTSPQTEGEAIVAALPGGIGTLELIEGAGHYPHVQFPARVFAAITPFLESVRA